MAQLESSPRLLCCAMALAAGTVLGCARDDSSTADDGSAGDTASGTRDAGGGGATSQVDHVAADFRVAWAVAWCKAQVRCGLPRPADPTCEYFKQQVYGARDEPLDEAVAAGRVIFHADAAEDLFEAARTVPCEELGHVVRVRQLAVFEGTVASGQACTLNEECSGESSCYGSAACPGWCGPREEDGDGCRNDGNCLVDSACWGAECGARLPVGADCSEYGNDCDEMLSCLPDSEGNSTCRLTAELYVNGLGEACGGSNPLCSPELHCADVGEKSHVCVEPSTDGGTCYAAYPPMCPSDRYCLIADSSSVEGTCVPRPTDGEDCSAVGCDRGHVCIHEVCRKVAPNGADCTADDECASWDCSDDGVCNAPLDCGNEMPD
jgi:hypothetical protein